MFCTHLTAVSTRGPSAAVRGTPRRSQYRRQLSFRRRTTNFSTKHAELKDEDTWARASLKAQQSHVRSQQSRVRSQQTTPADGQVVIAAQVEQELRLLGAADPRGKRDLLQICAQAYLCSMSFGSVHVDSFIQDSPVFRTWAADADSTPRPHRSGRGYRSLLCGRHGVLSVTRQLVTWTCDID